MYEPVALLFNKLLFALDGSMKLEPVYVGASLVLHVLNTLGVFLLCCTAAHAFSPVASSSSSSTAASGASEGPGSPRGRKQRAAAAAGGARGGAGAGVAGAGAAGGVPGGWTRNFVVGSAVGAAFWGVHPLRVECLAWASGQPYLLAAFFSIAAVAVRVSRRTGTRGSVSGGNGGGGIVGGGGGGQRMPRSPPRKPRSPARAGARRRQFGVNTGNTANTANALDGDLSPAATAAVVAAAAAEAEAGAGYRRFPNWFMAGVEAALLLCAILSKTAALSVPLALQCRG